MYSHWRMSSLDVFQESCFEKEWVFFLGIEKPTIFVNGKQIRPPKVSRQLKRISLERDIVRDCFLKKKKKQPLSEARSEMNLQGSRFESADRALRDSRPQVRSDILTAPQPLGLSGSIGPGSFDDKIRIRDVDFILSQALRMNMCEVSFFYGSRARTTTLGLWIGSIAFGKSPTRQPMTSLSEFIAKQVLCQPGLCSR